MNQADLNVSVDLGPRSYQIGIGHDCLKESGSRISQWLGMTNCGSLRCLLVTDAAIESSHAETVRQALVSSGAEVSVVAVPSGEQSKSFSQTTALYDRLVDMAADRKTVVIAVGGGVIGDLTGFAAATYARGLRFIQVPTTLLSMVDSSVGGKTGINHPRGKNLIGAFHQPAGVLIDLRTLNTLPDREYRSGLAEVVKYGVILDDDFLCYLEQQIDGLNQRTAGVLQHVVARSCQLKADVVRQDEFETTGLRAVLNYGHTFGHAFEALSGYGGLLHGEAVSIGMVCASRLAEKLGRISASYTERQIRLLAALSLPVTVPETLAERSDELLQCMMLDKKTEGRELRFVLPDSPGHVEVVRGVTPETAIECVRRCCTHR